METAGLFFCTFHEGIKPCIAGNLDPSDLSNSVKNGILYLEDPVDKVSYFINLFYKTHLQYDKMKFPHVQITSSHLQL